MRSFLKVSHSTPKILRFLPFSVRLIGLKSPARATNSSTTTGNMKGSLLLGRFDQSFSDPTQTFLSKDVTSWGYEGPGGRSIPRVRGGEGPPLLHNLTREDSPPVPRHGIVSKIGCIHGSYGRKGRCNGFLYDNNNYSIGQRGGIPVGVLPAKERGLNVFVCRSSRLPNDETSLVSTERRFISWSHMLGYSKVRVLTNFNKSIVL